MKWVICFLLLAAFFFASASIYYAPHSLNDRFTFEAILCLSTGVLLMPVLGM